MKEQTPGVLSVLMYLFHNHMGENCRIPKKQVGKLTGQLEDAGFDRDSIDQALTWLNNLTDAQNSLQAMSEKPAQSVRVFSEYERELLDTECRSYILMLEQMQILSPRLRELVLDLVIALEDEGIDVSLIKWVTLMVLYNDKEREDALANMELLVLNDTVGGIN